ncbi:hypothetical protein BDB01DRAFT_839278 [Pilobolus umbonatus]|nr:hypothetical protein BDB01DRAFT_839278 [Pilobolus umbonatus]
MTSSNDLSETLARIQDRSVELIHRRDDTNRGTSKVTDHPWLSLPYQPDLTHVSMEPNKINEDSNKYDWKNHSMSICRHILTRGLHQGIGSDIVVVIPEWNKEYKLHRLVLDQNSYFKLLLQGGFKESSEDRVELHFDSYITPESFDFVLEYLYGKISDPPITQQNVCQILATCSYFRMEMSGICVDYILKSLSEKNVVDYLLFADEHHIQGSDQICDAIYTFLCREAFGLNRNILCSIPLSWLQKVIESDAFWVPSEYDRYQFVLQIIQCKSEKNETWTENEEEIMDHILCYSIYYMHMSFEQLESIGRDINPFTDKPLVAQSVLKEALWLQVQLRTKVETATERDLELNVTTPYTEEDEEMEYYPIPTDDTTTYTGESALSIALTGGKKGSTQCSVYSPFRFSVEFFDVPSLKHGMRVYSETVFYAGSNWNMYIQKTRSPRKGVLQLGVYLHRQSIPSNNTLQENETWSFSRYGDKRKVVKTWFKIYCPSKSPKHALTLFQSSPDNFSVLQSWGWRSTTLCADEEVMDTAADTPPPLYSPQTSNPLQYLQSNYDLKTIKSALTSIQHKNTSTGPTLRFTIVMGHI